MWSRFSWRMLFAGAVVLLAVGILGWKEFFGVDISDLEVVVVHPQEYVQHVAISGDVVAAQTSDLGFAQSGRIAHVYALVGERVRAGQRIAEIDNNDLRAQLLQKQAALESAQANLSQLQEGTRPEEIAVTRAQIASDQSALQQANQGVLNAIQTAYTVSDDAVRNKLDQVFLNPTTANIDLVFVTTQSELSNTLKTSRITTERMLERWQEEIGSLSASQDLAVIEAHAQTNLAAVMQLLTNANAALNTAVASGATSVSTIASYVATVATARSNINSATASLSSAIATAQASAAQLAKDQKTLALQLAGSTPQAIAQAQANVAAARADVAAMEAQIAKTQIIAPFDGVITRMDVRRGEIVSPNTPEISLQGEGVFEIETYIPELSIAAVQVGDFASTTLDAYGADVSFDAQVLRIDPAKTERDGVATYKTTLVFLSRDERIRSGMTANVAIQTTRIPQAMVIPSGAVFTQNGVSAVQILEGKTVRTREVTIAGAALGNVAVLSGLKEGDQVVLSPHY
ncbi:MAG: hypothetical protein QG621_398 [Patescibacteria group bacterium]|nr:hypothetical protein [Patescibacteria group bacterium]